MKKRGQAGLITTIILIMIVLVSIVIVWNVVFAILNNSSSQTGVDQFSNTVNIESVKLLINGDLEVKVKKGSGNSTTNSLQFNVFDSTGAAYSITLNNTNLNALETKTYILNASMIKANNKIKTVSVYPALGNKLGMEAPAYDSALNKDSSGNLIPEIPTNPSSIGLVSWWKFDGNMQDSVGKYPGTDIGSISFTNDTIKGQVANFDGINDYVNISNFTLLNTSSNFTISVWTKISNNANTYKSIFNNGNPSSKTINLFYYGNYLIFDIGKTWNTEWLRISKIDSTLFNNNWHHVSVIYNGTANVAGITLYIDGNKTWFNSEYNNLIISSDISRPSYCIGWTSPSNFFNGSIDNIMIFNKSLNADEIKALYKNQK